MAKSIYPACDYPAWRPGAPVALTVVPPGACPYLPGRESQSRAFYAEALPAETYRGLMDAGFRRSGKVVYQPICRGCRACLPIRVLADQFALSKSQRRCWRRNEDLRISVREPRATEENFALYGRYLQGWHGSAEAPDWEDFVSFLYESPVPSVELSYRDGSGRLLAAGICDVGEDWLSSVYCYFDPAESQRGLGTYGALQELALCRKLDMPYYYLGFWVKDSRTMHYKAAFSPNEVLYPDGEWRGEEPRG